MSLTNAANYLASHGRNGDSMLVHMAPSEVAGLNAFAQQHGTQLTINPVTGLPEASVLKKFLRAAAPVALGIALPYAIPGLSALGAGSIVGGLSTLREMKVHNRKLGDSLMQGFMDGAAAWGGANMGQAWKALGEKAGEQAGEQAAKEATETAAEAAAKEAVVAGGTPPVAGAPTHQTLANFKNPALPGSPPPLTLGTQPTITLGGPNLPPNLSPVTMPPTYGPSMLGSVSPTPSPAGFLDTAKYAVQNPGEILPALGGGQRAAYTVGAAGLPFAQMAIEESQKDMGLPSAEQAKYKGYRYSKANIGRTRRKVAPYVPGVAMPEQRYFDYQTDYGPLEEYTAAAGGLMDAHNSLGSYSDGGRLLRGPGDGVSDDIPASINGDQPAKLADGEFVIPARDVAELGNGSTDAGARKLYAMLERLEKSRRVAKRGQDMRPERHLPA